MSEHDIDRPEDTPDSPPDPEVAASSTPVEADAEPDVPCIVPGVPFFQLDNPYGGFGIGILAGFDPAGRHEDGQPRTHPGTDTTPERERKVSGGSAHYVDLLTGKGWSVPLNPEVNA